MSAKKSGSSKGGARRRGAGGRGGGMPRIMWLAVVVCVLGAVFLFRTQSGEVPTGIGENRTVVTAPDVESNLGDDAPRSGDVDIAGETRELTPEKDESGTAAAATTPVQTKPAETKPADTKTTTTKPKATTTKTTTTQTESAPPPPLTRPAERGPYVVQIGSFGEADNADKEAKRLQGLGWDARVKVGNTSDGSIIYRVRIGYFPSRSAAEKFIRENRSTMRGAIAVHR